MSDDTSRVTAIPPGTARRAEVIAALRGVGLYLFEARDSEGYCWTLVAPHHSDARWQAQRIAEVSHRTVVCTVLIERIDDR